MPAEQHLAQYNVTMNQARDFIEANLDTPSVIFETAKEFGVTSWMLAEIYGGVSTMQTLKFFTDQGFDTREIDGNGTIFSMNFENQQVGPYTLEAFGADLGDRYKHTNLEGSAEIINTDGNNQLSVTSLANGIEKSLQAVKMFDDQREVFFSYDVTFKSPFHFTIGKIPGIGAIEGIDAKTPTGGKTAEAAPGFSHRLSFKEEGSVYIYSYDQDRTDGDYGDYLAFDVDSEPYLLPTDQVQHVEMYIRMNDPGVANGIVAAFINDQAVASITNGNFLQPGIEGINTMYLDYFHGGSISYAPEYDSTAVFDNIEISHLPSNVDLFLGY